MQIAKRFRFSIFAIAEWVMILPAAVFLAAAALRLLQPRQFEPAHTSWIIFDWTTAHIPRLGAAMLFLIMPGMVALAGCAALVRSWSENQTLRQDATLAFSIFRRHLAIGLLTTATLLAAAIFFLAVAHLVTD